MTPTPRERVPRGAVVLPPLRLSPYFVDYPWLTHLGAYQAAAVLLARGWRVDVVDGFARPGAALERRGDTAWLGEPPDRFLARLRRLRADLTIIAGSPFLLVPPGRAWLDELRRRRP